MRVTTLIIHIFQMFYASFLEFCMSIFGIDMQKSLALTSCMKKWIRPFKEIWRVWSQKIIFACCCPRSSRESRERQKSWISLGLQKLYCKLTIVTDTKICNIFLSMMSHSSSHPCCWWDIKKRQVKKKRQP